MNKLLEKSPVRRFWSKDVILFSTMLLSALSCLVASLVLSIDAVKLASDPTANLSCDINAIVSCGTVALSDQAQIFGFPNSFLGLICEPIVIMIAVAGLSGVKFPRWMLTVAQGVYFIGFVFALWLFYQSAFVIEAFCPWCLLVTVGTTLTFFTLLRYNIIHDRIFLPERLSNFAKTAVSLRIDSGLAVIILMVLAFVIFYNYGFSMFG